VGAAVVWLVGEFGKLIFRKDAMGFGDVKYCAMIGALLGWQIAVATLVLASILGALAGIVILLRTRQSRMPFGPYLSIAAALLFFHREAFFRLPALWMGFVYRTASRFDNLLSLRVLSVLLFLLFLGCCVILALLIMRNRVPGRIAQPPLGGEKQTEQEVASDGPNDETAG
jgi:Flp pilus assembly protein protease CpaA